MIEILSFKIKWLISDYSFEWGRKGSKSRKTLDPEVKDAPLGRRESARTP